MPSRRWRPSLSWRRHLPFSRRRHSRLLPGWRARLSPRWRTRLSPGRHPPGPAGIVEPAGPPPSVRFRQLPTRPSSGAAGQVSEALAQPWGETAPGTQPSQRAREGNLAVAMPSFGLRRAGSPRQCRPRYVIEKHDGGNVPIQRGQMHHIVVGPAPGFVSQHHPNPGRLVEGQIAPPRRQVHALNLLPGQILTGRQ